MKPTQITIPFANSGLKNDIPDANGQIGQATWQDGFPQITMQPLPPEGDGVPPDGMDMNGVLYEISKAAQYSQMGVLYKFDSSVVAAIGGYPKGAVLLNDAENAAYLSLVDSNTYNFNEQPSFIGQYWRPYAGAVILTTVTVTGSGNAITGITAENGAITATKGASFLPLTGGTMTGRIIRDGQFAVTSGDDGVINILGSTAAQNGAGLWLYGGDASAAGNFLLRAAQSGASTDLVGRNGGALTWGGKTAELIETRGSNYIRYVGGLQICWGSNNATNAGATYNYPAAFSRNVQMSIAPTAATYAYLTALSNTNFTIRTSRTDALAVRWMAIGYWD